MDRTKNNKNIFNKFSLTGLSAIVTGGAGLLGAEFCRTLVEAGAQVTIADLNIRAAQHLTDALSGKGFQVLPVQTDATQPESVREMVSRTVDEFGGVNILVNSAAMDPKFDLKQTSIKKEPSAAEKMTASFEEYPLESWRTAIEVNLTSAFICCQEVGKHMLAQGGGVIINISSIYGISGPDQRIYKTPDSPPQYKPAYYSVTKAGLLGLTRYLAAYYAGKNIRVNALSPGGVFNDNEDSFVQAYSARTILGRMAARDEMNGALLFLASDASKYMTGANLVVDGGWTAW